MRYLWILIIALVFPLAAHGYDTPEAFAGKVVDELGQAVGGATVWLTGIGPEAPKERVIMARTETAADGSFEFLDVPPAIENFPYYNVAAHKEGWALAWTKRMRRANRNILLTLGKEFPLQAQVVGPDDEPVAGVEPRVSSLDHRAGFDPLAIGEFGAYWGPPEEISDMIVQPGDETGSFTLRHVPPGVNVSLSVKDNRFTYTGARKAWRELRAGRLIEIVLQPPATIRGRLIDAKNGTARPGLEVALYAGGTTTSDEEGRFEFTNVRSGVHQVYLHELPTEFTAKAVSDITVEPGATVEDVELLVERGVTITGMVTAQDTRKPIADAGICCNTAQQPKVGSAWPLMKTGPDGRYSLQAPEGPAQLRTMGLPEGWRAAVSFHQRGYHRRFDVSGAQEPIEVNFEAIPAVSISGIVLDPQSQPAAGATVLLSSEEFFTADTVTDEAGQFVFTGLRPGEERALLAYRGEDMTLEDYVLKPEDSAPVTLRLQAGVRPTVTGQAVGADGQPASYALITVRPPMGGSPGAGVVTAYSKFWRTAWSHVLADEQGRFVARALWPDMDCQLRIRAGGYAEQEVDVAALMPGEQHDVGVISLPVADMVITGKVVTADGAPVPGIMVDVWRQRGYFSRRFMAATDTKGRFRFEGLPREEVTVAIDEFTKYQRARVPAGPGNTNIVITVIPKEEQILERHPLEPPLERKTEAVSATLYGLYRVKVISEEGKEQECLGLDVQAVCARREGGRGIVPSVQVVDNQGRRLVRIRGSVAVNRRQLRLYELPESDATALTIEVGSQASGYGEPLVFEPLRLMAPIEHASLLLMLGKLELTDEWIPEGPGARAVDKGEPPYLLARVYQLGQRAANLNADAAQAVEGGPKLIQKNKIYYGADSMSLACWFHVSYDQAGGKTMAMLPMRYGPAWMAGIQSGDQLLGCDGVDAKNEDEMWQRIREWPVGARVTLRIRRGEEELEIPVVLGQWEEDFQREAEQALKTLRQWAYPPPEEPTLICYELQSAGGHGQIPIPDALSVTFSTHIYETVGQVTIEDVPLPPNLRRE